VKLRIAASRSLATAPLILIAADRPDLYELNFFTDHDLALRELTEGRVDLLSTGYTETERLPQADRPERLCTFVWGLSALMVRQVGLTNLMELAEYLSGEPGAALILPFAKSPLDLEMRALFKRLLPERTIPLINAPLPETFAAFQQGKIAAAVLPEPMPTILEFSGKAIRFADVAELERQATGDRGSPQVALFMKKGHALPVEFMPGFRRAILLLSNLPALQCHTVAEQLLIPEPVLKMAITHVIFDLPVARENTRNYINS
jgi:hypothetical protein